jgi:hypothetical protein
MNDPIHNFDYVMDPRGAPGDANLYVEFKLHPVMLPDESEKAGRPIYQEREFVSIIAPGSRDEVYREVEESDKQRWPKQYGAFKEGRDQAMLGTPLALMPGISLSQVEEFAYFKIKTVEALASLNDNLANRFPTFHELKRKAQAFLVVNEEKGRLAAAKEQLQGELATRDTEIEALKAQLQELAAAVAAASKGKK